MNAGRKTAGVFLGAIAAVVVPLSIGVPTANACYDWDYGCHNNNGMIWRDGPPGQPNVWVEHWKWDYRWNWRCDEWGRWDYYLDPPFHTYNQGPGYYPGYGHDGNFVDVQFPGGYVGVG